MPRKLIIVFLLLVAGIVSIAGATSRRAVAKDFTLVIDAGHGGSDTGAPGASSLEKNLTLRYALAFGKMVESQCPDVKVIYTRQTDVFVPLHERAAIANRAHADLFVSIHINALDRNHTAQGFQSYSLGRGERSGDRGIKENLEVAKRENSVILLEKDYKTNYANLDNSAETDIIYEIMADKNRERSVELSRLMQKEVCRATGRRDGGSHQNNLAVLRLTSMPAVLLELGFISTPAEEQFLNSDAALPMYVAGMYNAFIKYKNKYDDNITPPYREPTTIETASAMVGTPSAAPRDREPATASAPAKADNPQQPTTTPKPKTTTPNPKTPAPKPKERAPKPKATTPQPKAKDKKDAPVFKVQIIAGRVKLKAGDKQFKGLTGVETIDMGERYVYTYGSSTDYNQINRLRRQLADKFPGCHVIAFKGGKQMDVNEAIKEFLANKK